MKRSTKLNVAGYISAALSLVAVFMGWPRDGGLAAAIMAAVYFAAALICREIEERCQ